MTTELLYQQPVVLIAIVLLACMLIAGESGYRLGRRGCQAHKDLIRVQIGSIQVVILGLLALLLGFTFAMALSRFEYDQPPITGPHSELVPEPVPHGMMRSSISPGQDRLLLRALEGDNQANCAA